MPDDRDESRRAASRRERRTAGDRSARLANALMKVAPSVLDKLELDEDLREVVDQARAIPSLNARRRAERTVAGALRRVDLIELQKKLATIEETGTAIDTQVFHLAEQWRARLIEEGLAAAETFPGGAADPLPTLIANARRERETGKPPGAARALFRHVMAALQAQRAPAPADDDADEPDDDV